MTVPDTHYVDAGGLRIAYQQWGSGPPCLIVPALISNVEIAWEHELYRRTLEQGIDDQWRLYSVAAPEGLPQR